MDSTSMCIPSPFFSFLVIRFAFRSALTRRRLPPPPRTRRGSSTEFSSLHILDDGPGIRFVPVPLFLCVQLVLQSVGRVRLKACVFFLELFDIKANAERMRHLGHWYCVITCIAARCWSRITFVACRFCADAPISWGKEGHISLYLSLSPLHHTRPMTRPLFLSIAYLG
jgi:hypothetical protein